MTKCKVVLLFSGKRKSGKDYITELLASRLREKAIILRLSGPLKECYAGEKGLDFEQMLTSGSYRSSTDWQ